MKGSLYHMGTIFYMGGAMPNDGPMAPIQDQDFTTCQHCQATILFDFDLTSPVGRRLRSDYCCPECEGKPVCVPCGELLKAGAKCPGPYRIVGKMRHA